MGEFKNIKKSSMKETLIIVFEILVVFIASSNKLMVVEKSNVWMMSKRGRQ